MAAKRPLTPEEEKRCLDALDLLGIDTPDHPILSQRGYFGLYLTGLSPDEVGETDHPSAQEFREVISLLSIAGPERLREMLKHAAMKKNGVDEEPPQDQPLPLTGDYLPHFHKPKEDQQREVDPHHIPVSPLRQRMREKYGALSPPAYSRDSGSQSRIRKTTSETHKPAPGIPETSPPGGIETPASGGQGEIRARFSKNIQPIEPPPAAQERHRHLPHPESREETVFVASQLMEQSFYHDAHHVAADYLAHEGLSDQVLEICFEIIRRAGKFDRNRGLPPFNMLWECEELAHLLARWIPDVSHLRQRADEATSQMYHLARRIYTVWTEHAASLLEYRYQVSNGLYMKREWVDPRNVGFLLDVMRTAVHSKLPLDLLRFVYERLRECIEIPKQVINQKEKKARFEADVLRIIASPTKDVIPDMQFQIYRDIIDAFLDEGDTSMAWTFTKQALLIHPANKDLLEIKRDLESKGAHPRKSPYG